MDDQTVYNITIGDALQPGKLTVLNGSIDIQLADGSYFMKDGVLQGLAGTKVYFVAATSGASPTKQLVFVNGLLVNEV